MQSLLRALVADRQAALSGPGTNAVEPRGGLRRFAWVPLVVVLMIAAAVALGQIDTTAQLADVAAEPTPASTIETPSVAADEVSVYLEPITGQAETNWGALVGDLAIKLAGVLALIVATLWLIRAVRRRRDPRSSDGSAGDGFAEILDRTELAPGQHVYVLDLGDRVVVLGATAQQLTSLTEITANDEIEALRRRTGLRKSRGFADLLAGAVERTIPRATDRGATTPAADAEDRPTLARSARRLRTLARTFREADRPVA